MSQWNLEAAVKHLVDNAKSKPTAECAKYVRRAIEAGGVTLIRHNSAKDYGSSLIKVGFKKVTVPPPQRGQKGDVVVMQAIGTHIHGHMQMYSGSKWISDYNQSGFYPYRVSRPEYQFYRFPLAEVPKSTPTPGFRYGMPGFYDSLGPTVGGVGTPSTPGGASPSASSTTLSRSAGTTTSTGAPPYPGRSFRIGSRGSHVESIQRRLTALGWPLEDDGKYGKFTKSAVTSFQITHRLSDDGIVGKNTWRALFGK